jgi:hypothetical protein
MVSGSMKTGSPKWLADECARWKRIIISTLNLGDFKKLNQ